MRTHTRVRYSVGSRAWNVLVLGGDFTCIAAHFGEEDDAVGLCDSGNDLVGWEDVGRVDRLRCEEGMGMAKEKGE